MLKIYFQFDDENILYISKVDGKSEEFLQLNNCELLKEDFKGNFMHDMIIGAKAVKLKIDCLLISPIISYIIKDKIIIGFALNKNNRIPHSCTINGETCGIVYQKDTLYGARNWESNEYTLFDINSGEVYKGFNKDQYKSIIQHF